MGLFIEHKRSWQPPLIRKRCAGWRRGCVLPGLRFGIAVHRFCRPGQRSATGRERVLFK
ncbi:hypothetical protein KCP70_21580 [Salmonella enterica subsp. enterica]|nr:hypothetical protein KCP70_21580 [Salmonella enterica subsp. enterica]